MAVATKAEQAPEFGAFLQIVFGGLRERRVVIFSECRPQFLTQQPTTLRVIEWFCGDADGQTPDPRSRSLVLFIDSDFALGTVTAPADVSHLTFAGAPLPSFPTTTGRALPQDGGLENVSGRFGAGIPA